MDWVLLIYFMVAAQPANTATKVPMKSEIACVDAGKRVKQQFAIYWASKRYEDEVKRWEISRRRSGSPAPSGDEIALLMAQKKYKKTFESKFGKGSSARYLGPFPSAKPSDLRIANNSIFTVCLPSG